MFLSQQPQSGFHSRSLLIQFLIFSALLLASVYSVAANYQGSLDKIDSEVLNRLPKIAQAQTAKFVVFQDAEKKWTEVVFIDPAEFQFHYQFLAKISGAPYGKNFEEVESVSLAREGRKVLLGLFQTEMTTSEGQWDFLNSYSLTTKELPSPELLRSVEKAVNDWVHKNGSGLPDAGVAYIPRMSLLPELAAKSKSYLGVSIRQPSQPAGRKVYNSGLGIGVVKVLETQEQIDQALNKGEIGPETILVTNADLRQLPPVAAVISGNSATEASHLVLLAQMYGIPLAYESKAVEKYTASVDQFAILQTSLEDYATFDFYDKLTRDDFEYLVSLKADRVIDIQFDSADKPIADVASLHKSDVGSYGGKAVGFGILKRQIADNTRKKAFSIPLSNYLKFVKIAELDDGTSLSDKIKSELSGLDKKSSYYQVDQAATNIREAFMEVDLEQEKVADLLAGIRSQLQALFKEEIEARNGKKFKVKLRSSSNVEDGDKFNGAGLYESKGVCLQNCKKGKDDYAVDLVTVWSSLYSTKGLWARLQFSVDDKQVGMAVLAHQPYKGELYQGVIRFKKEDDRSYSEISGVIGEEDSVTNAKNGGTNELVEMFDDNITDHRPYYNGKGTPFPKFRFMMDRKHYTKLGELMGVLYDNWKDAKPGFEIESEWKVIKTKEGGEKVHLKQVRLVPKPKVLKTKTPVFVTGESVDLVGRWPSSAFLMRYRPQVMKVKMPRATFDEIAAGKVGPKISELIIDGKSVKVSVTSSKVESSEYTHDITTHYKVVDQSLPVLLRRFKIEYSFSRQISDEVVSPRSDHFRVVMFFEDVKFGSRIELTEAIDATLPLDDEEREEEFERGGADTDCRYEMRGFSKARAVHTDDEFRTFDQVTVKFPFSDREIKLGGFPQTRYYLQQHEVSSDIWLDLFSDSSLTGAEKKLLLKKGGRYLAVGNYYAHLYQEDLQTRTSLCD